MRKLDQPLEHRPRGGHAVEPAIAVEVTLIEDPGRRGRDPEPDLVGGRDGEAELWPAIPGVAREQQLHVVLGRREQRRHQIPGLAREQLDLARERELRVRVAQPDHVGAPAAAEVDLELALALEVTVGVDLPLVDAEPEP